MIFVDTSVVLTDKATGAPVCGANFWIRRVEPNNEACGATNAPDGFASFWCRADEDGLPAAVLTIRAQGYDDVRQEIAIHPGMGMIRVALSSSIKPHKTKLDGSLVITGPYPKGPRPGTPNNALFVDEIDTLSGDVQDAVIAQLVREGADHITVGPIVAKGYHGQYDDTNWVGNYEPILRVMRKARAAGLGVVLVALPDVEPYFHTDEQSGGTWDWTLIERDFTPFFQHPEVQALVTEIQHGWENICLNEEFVRVFQYLTRMFPTLRRWWHGWPDHSAPGLSSESMGEAEMTRRVKEAGCTGFGWQSKARGLPDDVRNKDGRLPLEQFRYDVGDFIAHLRDGKSGWPGGMDSWPREYQAYWVYGDGYPVTGTPSDWGQAAREVAREMGYQTIGAGDGGPVNRME